MSPTAPADRLIRVLVVTPQEGCPLLDVAQLVACLRGMRLVRVATDCNDGLRLALMTYPDVIVLPWNAAAAKLLRALDHLRNPHFSPQVVVVANQSEPLEGLTSCRMAIITVGADPLHPDGLTDSLRAMLADNSARFQANGDDNKFTRTM
jgi:DNA-binding response OmpR family regulator